MNSTFGGFRERYAPTAPTIVLPPVGEDVGSVQIVKIEANVSASQLKTKKMCARKWAFEKLLGLRQRSAQHFVVGHALHSVAERYLLRQAKSWADLFPPAWDKGLESHQSDWIKLMAELAVTKGMWQSSDQVQVEYPLVMLVGKEHLDHRGMPRVARATTYFDAEGVRRHGKPQCMYDGSPLPLGWDRLPPYVGFIDVAHLHSTPAQIEDHKTAKNKKYALNSEKLAQDLQVLTYAALPLSLRPDLDQVRLKHNVFLKDGEAKVPCYPVVAYANVAMVARQWNEVITEVEDMQRIRSTFSAPAGQPQPMMTNWHQVPCAIDVGKTKDACEAYGGCPFKDVCFGRASIEQVASRLNSPDPAGAYKNRVEAMSFNVHGMRTKWLAKVSAELPAVPTLTINQPADVATSALPKSTTPPTTKERHMPFGPRNTQPAPLAVHDIVYVPEPDNGAIQYKASILNPGYGAPGEPKTAIIAIWPDVNVQPDVFSLGKAFVVEDVPLVMISRTQFPGAQLTGYAEVGASTGAWTAADLSWKALPMTKKPEVVKPVAAVAEVTKVPDKKGHDGKFGGGFASRAAAAPAPAFVPPMPEAVPAPAFTPVVGQVLRVLPNAGNAFWSALAGKEAVVDEVTMGANGEVVTVAIANAPYPNVAAGRFELLRQPTGPVPAVVYVTEGDHIPPGTIDPTKPLPPSPTSEVNPDEGPTLATFEAMVGKIVSVRQVGIAVPLNGVLEKVTEHGIEMMGGSFKAHWDKVESIELFVASEHQPGYTPPKKTKEEKAADKAAAAVAKESEKAAAAAAKEAKKAAAAAAKEAEKERVRLQKIQDKADAAAKKVVDQETARAAAKAAKKAAAPATLLATGGDAANDVLPVPDMNISLGAGGITAPLLSNDKITTLSAMHAGKPPAPCTAAELKAAVAVALEAINKVHRMVEVLR